MAIFLSARVLGWELGLGRAIGAIMFAVIIGLLMAFFFRRSEQKRVEAAEIPEDLPSGRPLWKTGLFFVCMILFLVFSDWYNTNDATVLMKDGTSIKVHIRYDTLNSVDVQRYEADGRLAPKVERIDKAQIVEVKPEESFTQTIHGIKWYLAGLMGLLILLMVWRWFSMPEVKDWMQATWDFGLMIVPLLFGGVFVTGFIGGLIPETAVATVVGGNSLLSNFFASFVGMIWYFATLTEIPIVEMLTRLGMGKGPALALLLAGPALSLPSLLVIYKILGFKKTFVFSLLTVLMSTFVGWMFGSFFT
jgi:hypothetical protein